MRKFRRSTNKSQDKLSIRLNPKDASAITPPKKVICATHPYEPPADHEDCLAFRAGDYFHVIDREDDENWYEVLDLTGKRGLVPRAYFQDVGKKDLRKQPHDSGYSEDQSSIRKSVGGPDAAEAARKQSVSGIGGVRQGNMIYGVVIYEFNAERPDELDAKPGDHVIIIAQSNPEWSSSTNTKVADPLEAIRAAGIPKVEEWKQRAAWYKSNSVPLGTLSQPGAQDLSPSMERMSIATSHTNRGRESWQQQQRRSGNISAASTTPVTPTGPNRLIAPQSARALGFSQDPPTGEFYFHVDVNGADGRAWALQRSYKEFWELQMHLMEQFPEASGKVPGKKRTLPSLPGPVPYTSENLTRQRLPHMDDYLRRVLRVHPQISNSHPMKLFFSPREEDQEMAPFEDEGMDRMSQFSQSSSQQRDYSAQSSTTSLSERNVPYGSPTRQHPSQAQQYAYPPMQQPQQHYRNASESTVQNGHSNEGGAHMSQSNGAYTNGSMSHPAQAAGSTGPAQSSAVVKIKVFLPSDNCVLLRLPGTFIFDDLMNKVRERYFLEPERDQSDDEDVELAISYKDEETMQFYSIRDDEDLNIARNRNDKLTLKINVV